MISPPCGTRDIPCWANPLYWYPVQLNDEELFRFLQDTPQPVATTLAVMMRNIMETIKRTNWKAMAGYLLYGAMVMAVLMIIISYFFICNWNITRTSSMPVRMVRHIPAIAELAKLSLHMGALSMNRLLSIVSVSVTKKRQ